MKRVPSRQQFWSACLGNLFEHYDNALFGFLSPFLAPLIFPKQEPITALILTYAMIPLGMLARPFGSLIFGYIGDRFGRQQALFLTLAGMAAVSGCIAFSPTYQQAGFISPLIFCIGRALQNFFASGESMGGAIYLLENTEEKRHDLFSGLYNASTIGGCLFASGGVALLCYFHVEEWGWRLLYLFGCTTALFGWWLRKKSPQEVIPSTQPPPSPFSVASLRTLSRTFWDHRKALLLIITAAGFSYANYTIALILMNGFIPLVSSWTKAEMMNLNTLLLILDFAALPLFGWLASKVSREKLMAAAALGVALCALPLTLLLQDASLFSIVGIRICLVLFGVAFCAPFHAWTQQLVPSAHRYMIISFGYAIGSQLLGGPTAAISLWLYKTTNSISSISWYWMALSCASLLVLAQAAMKKKVRARF